MAPGCGCKQRSRAQLAAAAADTSAAALQAGQPLWAIRNHPDGCPLLHLSYHDGEHYNSVRMADDYGQARPAAIVMGAASAAAQVGCWCTELPAAAPVLPKMAMVVHEGCGRLPAPSAPGTPAACCRARPRALPG